MIALVHDYIVLLFRILYQYNVYIYTCISILYFRLLHYYDIVVLYYYSILVL